MDAQPTDPAGFHPHPILPADAPQTPPESLSKSPSDFHPLDPRNQKLDQIVGLIISVIVTIAIPIGLGFVWFNLGIGPILFGTAIGGFVIIGLSFGGAIFWPPLAHRHASWRLDDEGLEIRRGVLWRHQITIPLGRVQHADVSQGPFQRFFEIGTLTVHTAGTQNASIELEGLTHGKAIEIRDELVRQRKDQHVV